MVRRCVGDAPVFDLHLAQVVEDRGRDFRQSGYALDEPAALLHLALAVLVFTFAFRAGAMFRRTGSRSRGGRWALRLLLVLTVALGLIGLVYLALASAAFLAIPGARADNIVRAHILFASVLTVTSGSLAYFCARRLGIGGSRRSPRA